MGQQPRLVGADPDAPKTHWKKRIRCVTFQWYTVVMGTGGFSFMLEEINIAYGGHWLITLSDIIYIYTIILFLAITALIGARFVLHPPSLKHVFMHPQESNFVCCLPLALATIIANAAELGVRDTGFWLAKACLVMWLIYVVLALLCALVIPLLQWTVQRHPLEDWTPLWIMAPLCVTFNGAVAYEFLEYLPAYTAVWVIIFSYILVGFGCLIGLLYVGAWILRLVSFGAPPPKMAPIFFIALGPVAWGSFGLIALGIEAERSFPTAVAGGPLLGSADSGTIFSIASLCIGLVLWGLSWFLTGTGLLYYLLSIGKRDLALSSGALNNWGLTFPLTGHISVSALLGTRFQSRFFNDIFIIQLVIWIVACWGYATVTTIYGVYRGEIAAEGCDCNMPSGGPYLGDYEKSDEDEQSSKDEHRANGPANAV